jgi:electron transfer flavoprotein beta subunit
MKIIVCIKQVPARDSLLRIDPAASWIQEAGLNYEINEPDTYALEEGLRLKEKHGGETVVLSAGPARAGQAIREALAKGADRAIHVECDNLNALSPLEAGKLMAGAIAPESPDLVLTGLQSDDAGYGQTGVILAELLGLPHATLAIEIEAREGALRVKRELEGGWFQYVEMPLPALATVQSGINRPRYATLMGIKRAKNKEVRHVPAVPAPGAPGFQVTRVYLPERGKQTQLLDGNPREAAARLVERLRFEARVL